MKYQNNMNMEMEMRYIATPNIYLQNNNI